MRPGLEIEMNRLNRLARILKIAQISDAGSEDHKIRQTEERAGMTLEEFENKVARLILKERIRSEEIGIEMDMSELEIDGPAMVRALLDDADKVADPAFFPYTFLSERKTPEDYFNFLKGNGVI
jgi:hypothetical protein